MESVPKKRAASPTVLKRKPVSTKRAAKKTAPTTAKVAVSKRTAPSQKTAVARARKRSIAKAGPDKKVESKPSLRKIKKESEGAKAAVTSEEVILVSGTPSLRLKEKVAIYEAWYRERSHLYVRPVAHVFGYSFILFGFFTAFSISAAVPLKDMNLFATIECAVGSNCENLIGTNNETEQVLLMPQIEFITPIQIVPGQDTDFRVKVLNATTHSLSVISLHDGRKLVLSPKGNEGDIFLYRLPSSDLDPGEYKIYARALAIGTQNPTEFAGPIFVIPHTTDGSDEPDTETGGTETEAEANDGDQDITSEELMPDTDTNNEAENIEEEEEEEERDKITLTREPEVEVSEELEDEPVKVEEKETELKPALSLAITPGVMPAQYKIAITPTYKYSAVELYARAENSTQASFLGIASPTASGWLYWLDASSLPAGKFKIIARGLEGNTVKDMAELRFENKVGNNEQDYKDDEEYLRTKEEIEMQAAELEKSQIKIDVAEVASNPEPKTEPVAREQEVEKVNDLLFTHSDDFNKLLQSYASGVQSGDETIQRLSESALDEKIFTILGDEVINSEFETSVFALETDIRLKLESIKEQIKKVEELKRERTAEASSVDTDSDGISDYDEYLLYGTDPKNPDSDNDGVTDGVEIGAGFDPLDARGEAVIRFNSPKDVTYVDNSVLSVEQVAPLLLYETDVETPMVQAEIVGRGLPNSYVTLYIFSDPIVVTVRTKDDGSFSYTFTKELEDGEHEVYAALTDNKGEIVVRSTPFRFVKEAQAFTYVDDANASNVVTTELAEIDAPYNTVAAMGVVSFGLILLLLGQTLRREEDKSTESSV